MWLGGDLRNPLVVRPDGRSAPRDSGMRAPSDGPRLSLASGKLFIGSRELVAKITNETL